MGRLVGMGDKVGLESKVGGVVWWVSSGDKGWVWMTHIQYLLQELC